MLKEKLKSDLVQAMRDKDDNKKNVLRIILGDVATIESKESAQTLTDEQVQKMIRKLIASNEEVLAHKQDESLVQENEFLNGYLPQLLSQEKIRSILEESGLTLTEGATGQSIGLAMKYLKSNGHAVDGKDVTAVVKEMRGE